jgi:hypothetical protein
MKLLLTFLLLVVPVAVRAQFTYTTNDDNTITITGYTGSNGVVVIPDMTNGYPVTSIGSQAFVYSKLTEVTIPDSVSDIGDEAFYGHHDSKWRHR